MVSGNQPRAVRSHPPIGERVRAERLARGLSLRELADRVGLSPSLISQIETGRARPSVQTLYALADELTISIDELLFPNGRLDAAVEERGERSDAEQGPVQRAATRKKIRLASGVVWERLTTRSDPETEFLYVIYEVGGASSPEHEFQRHGGREWGFVISGRLGVTIAFDDHELGPGDAISFESSTPHRLYNRGEEPVHAVWFVLGRTSGERERQPHPHERAAG